MTEIQEMHTHMKNAFSGLYMAWGRLSGMPPSPTRDRFMAELERAGKCLDAVVIAESLYPRES
jgi:hypothetical protein